MAQVKALRDFYDRAADVNRKKGDVFDATQERIAQLNACEEQQWFEPLVEEVAAPKAAPKKTSKPVAKAARK